MYVWFKYSKLNGGKFMIGYLNNIYKAGAYIRLSKEDENGGLESASVINQRNYIKEPEEKALNLFYQISRYAFYIFRLGNSVRGMPP